jgi:hypothetical protein
VAKHDSHLVVRRAATGLGLFTLVGIPPGKRIVEYVGPVVTAGEVARRGGRYFFEIDGHYSVDGSARGNKARYLNHSCRPNAEAFVTGRRIWIWSKEEIEAGEEVTIHYGEVYFDTFIRPKGCGCAACRSRTGRANAAKG